MTAVDTSAEAIESAWEEFEVSSKPTGESDGYEMFNVEGMGDDAWNIIVITRALAAERDALRLSLAEARNEALDEASMVCTGDEDRPSPVSAAKLRRMSVQDQFAYEQRRLAWADADEIHALKTPTGDTE